MTMIDYTVTTPRPSLFSTVVALIGDVARATRNRRAFYRMGQLTDVELHDIGLTRGDLNVPVDLPFSYDPTAHLNRSARKQIDRMQTWGAYRA